MKYFKRKNLICIFAVVFAFSLLGFSVKVYKIQKAKAQRDKEFYVKFSSNIKSVQTSYEEYIDNLKNADKSEAKKLLKSQYNTMQNKLIKLSQLYHGKVPKKFKHDAKDYYEVFKQYNGFIVECCETKPECTTIDDTTKLGKKLVDKTSKVLTICDKHLK